MIGESSLEIYRDTRTQLNAVFHLGKLFLDSWQLQHKLLVAYDSLPKSLDQVNWEDAFGDGGLFRSTDAIRIKSFSCSRHPKRLYGESQP